MQYVEDLGKIKTIFLETFITQNIKYILYCVQ